MNNKKKGNLAASQSALPEPAIVWGKEYTTEKNNSVAQLRLLTTSDAAPDTDKLH